MMKRSTSKLQAEKLIAFAFGEPASPQMLAAAYENRDGVGRSFIAQSNIAIQWWRVSVNMPQIYWSKILNKLLEYQYYYIDDIQDGGRVPHSDDRFLEVEQKNMTMTLMMRTVRRQKESSFLLVSCWYWLASSSSFLPRLRLSLTLLMVLAAMLSFMPWSRIMLPVSLAILFILLTRISISLISCWSSSSIFLRSSCLLLARICPESCCWLIWFISICPSMLLCFERSLFMNSIFFFNSYGWCEFMKSLFICFIRYRRADSSSISASEICNSLQYRFAFSYYARRGARFRTFVYERMSVLRDFSFSMEALMEPPSFQSFLSFSPMLMAFLSSMQVGRFLRYCSRLIIVGSNNECQNQ